MKRIIGFPSCSPLVVDSLMPLGLKRSADINKIDCKIFYTRSKSQALRSPVDFVFVFLPSEELEKIENIEIIDDTNLTTELIEKVMEKPLEVKKEVKKPAAKKKIIKKKVSKKKTKKKTAKKLAKKKISKKKVAKKKAKKKTTKKLSKKKVRGK